MHRILVAEDDADIRTIVKDLLKFSDYDVVTATNGQECLDYLADHKVDLLILDFSMPKVDGWEVLRRLRADRARAALPIIALTAHALAGDQEKMLEAGCQAYIAKPFQIPTLIEEVARILHT